MHGAGTGLDDKQPGALWRIVPPLMPSDPNSLKKPGNPIEGVLGKPFGASLKLLRIFY
jgi:hypothetical protein